VPTAPHLLALKKPLVLNKLKIYIKKVPIKIVKKPVKLEELKAIAEEQFVDFVKAVVDVEQEIMAVGGELHADEESLLIDQGSKYKNLWGINLWINKPQAEWVEFDSLINIKPAVNNRSRAVENPTVQQKIIAIVAKLIQK